MEANAKLNSIAKGKHDGNRDWNSDLYWNFVVEECSEQVGICYAWYAKFLLYHVPKFAFGEKVNRKNQKSIDFIHKRLSFNI